MSLKSVIQQKALLRKEIRTKLRDLAASDRQHQSDMVTAKLLLHPKYQSSLSVAVFISMPDEIDTHKIIEDIFQKGKRCFLPRYDEQGTEMTMVSLKSLADLTSLPKTKWNIPQPAKNDEREDCLQTGSIDLILTPGLGFTTDGHRIGRGRGYYDNFLKTYCSKFPHPYTLGLALKQCIVDQIPTTPDDFQLDEVITA